MMGQLNIGLLSISLLFFISLSAQQHGEEELLVSYQQESGVVPPGNLYQGLNAADPDNEVNGTANTGTFLGSPVWTSETDFVQDGSYALKLRHAGSPSTQRGGNTTLVGVQNGDAIDVFVYVRESVNRWRIRLPSSDWSTEVVVNPDAVGTWQEYTLSATATTNAPMLEFYTTTGGQGSDFIHVDNIRAIKTN